MSRVAVPGNVVLASHPWLKCPRSHGGRNGSGVVEVWPLGVMLIVYALRPLLAMLIALWGSRPEERPEILRALAELFRRRGGGEPRLPPPDDPDRHP